MRTAEKLLHIFTPRESNNHKPKILHTSSILGISFALIVLQLFLFIGGKKGPSVLGYAANISPDEVVRLTNQKRAEVGLPELKFNATLSQAAHNKGENMLDMDYWAHVAPDGTQPWKFLSEVGYKYKFAGENLARDFSNSQSAVEAWMASPSHKENILSPKYTEIGVAVVEGDLSGTDTTLIVQFFGNEGEGVVPVAQAKETDTGNIASQGGEEAALNTPIPKVDNMPSELVVGTSETLSGSQNKVLVSPFYTTKDISMIVVGILLVVLVIDGIVISRRKIARIGGKTFAHIAFLGIILAIVIIIKAGQIL